jgi:hypothetical protein
MDDFKPGGGQFIGLPLWDEVKKTIYDYWTEGNFYLALIDKIRVNQEYDDYGEDEARFKASTLKLYRSCKNKFEYHDNDKRIQALIKLNLPGGTKDFSLARAEELFDELGYFLEIDGITRFEKREADKGHLFIDGLE